VNSRFALETAELVRAQKGDGKVGAFCHDVSRAFFTEHADISKREVIVPIAERFGISASDVETAWHERRFSPTVDAFIEDGHKVGVRGVPAMGWPNRRAIVGLMPPTELVLRLRNEATEATNRASAEPLSDVYRVKADTTIKDVGDTVGGCFLIGKVDSKKQT
jgi:predicted DsbA family dithiol-disulfide isomerase